MNLHHLALRTADLPRLLAFYRDLLGLRERARRHYEDGTLRAVWLATGSVVLMLEQAEPDEPPPARGGMDLVAFAIERETREQWRAKLNAARVLIEDETAHTLYVRDPDGRRVGVSSYPFSD